MFLAAPRLFYLWIAIGSGLGGAGRFAVSQWLASDHPTGFPFATLLVNVAGSFIIGFFAGLSGPDGRLLVSPGGRQFVMAGLCGGFTTFSAFSLETLGLIQQHAWIAALLNIVVSLVACLVFVWGGHVAANGLNSRAAAGRRIE
jgi:CrcB protein